MRHGPTVISAVIAVAASALADAETLPQWLHQSSLCLAALSYTLFGFFLASPGRAGLTIRNTMTALPTALCGALLLTLVAGCTSASRTTTAKDGAITQTTVHTLLTTMTGFSDSVTSPDGIISSTHIDNYASDIAAIQALGQVLQTTMAQVLAATKATNICTSNSCPITTATLTPPH